MVVEKDLIEDLGDLIQRLQEHKRELEKGEELCDHNWSNSSLMYICRCKECKKCCASVQNEYDIPLKRDARCRDCLQVTEEEKL